MSPGSREIAHIAYAEAIYTLKSAKIKEQNKATENFTVEDHALAVRGGPKGKGSGVSRPVGGLEMDERAAGKRCKNPGAGFLSPMASTRKYFLGHSSRGDRLSRNVRIRMGRGQRGRRRRAQAESRHGRKEAEV